MQFYSIDGSFVDVKEGAALILVLKLKLTLKREGSLDFIWNVLKITMMDFESVRPLILVAKNSLLLLQIRSLEQAPLIEVKSKANYRSCERAALPQVMPLIKIDGELRVSVMSVRAVNIELEKSPVSRVMTGFCLKETVALTYLKIGNILC